MVNFYLYKNMETGKVVIKEIKNLECLLSCSIPASKSDKKCIVQYKDYLFDAYPVNDLESSTIGLPLELMETLSLKSGTEIKYSIQESLAVPEIEKIIVEIEGDESFNKQPDEEEIRFKIEIFKNIMNVFQLLKVEVFSEKYNYRVKGLFSSNESVKYGRLKSDFVLEFPPRTNALLKNGKFDPVELGIGGLTEQINEITRIVFTSRLYPKELQKSLKIKHVKGVLLYGPPGNGKTLIARHLSRALNAEECIIVNGPEFLDRFVGEGEKKIRELFAKPKEDEARNHENSGLYVIIFDEFDAIGKKRGMDSASSHTDSLVTQLLSCIDGVESLNNILIFAMTNRKDMIDPALLRPGRIEVHIEINLPSHEGRIEILKIHSRLASSQGLLSDIDFNKIAKRTKNFSGAELEAVVSRALKEGMYSNIDPMTFEVKNENFKVNTEHFYKAIKSIKPMFGADENFLKASELIDLGPRFSNAQRLLNNALKAGETQNFSSLLVYGPQGSGKSSMVDYEVSKSNFSYTRKISPGSLSGLNKYGKISILNESFENAMRSESSLIVVEDIELLIEYIPSINSLNRAVYSEIISLLKRNVPEHRKFMIIGTTSNRKALKNLSILPLFQGYIKLPPLDTKDELANAKNHLGLNGKSGKVCLPMPLKKVLWSLKYGPHN